MFETASRKKYRFGSIGGSVSVEDLWDLPLISDKGRSLEKIWKGLNKEVKEISEDSFLGKKSPKDTLAERKFEIVKHIVKVKQGESEARLVKADNKQKKEKYLAMIEEKEEAGLTLEELKKRVKDL